MNEPAVKALGNALACGRDLVIQTCQVGRITAMPGSTGMSMQLYTAHQ